MLPAYAAPEILPLAPDHSGGSASDVSLGLPSGCRACVNGHWRSSGLARRYAGAFLSLGLLGWLLSTLLND